MSKTQYLIGIDIGSSSVKAAVVDASDGKCLSTAFSPETEMPISSPFPGWAEQHPSEWELHARLAVGKAVQKAGINPAGIASVGICYQMHGLVCLDKNGEILRPSIIWCDSRAVETGNKAFNNLGRDFCLSHYLNSPGNFTASKLSWVRENEPSVFEKISAVMLPGDWLAYRLTGEQCITRSGLSEGILWDFQRNSLASELLHYYGISEDLLPPVSETFSIQGRLTAKAAEAFNLPAGIPVSYRAGDQPNNAFSLRAVNPGDFAATAGTSGVVYCVTDKKACDMHSRVNTFVHVTGSESRPLYGVLLCINGTGISNSWMRKLAGSASYQQMNLEASKVGAGSDNLLFIPFGNGAERMLNNVNLHATFSNIDFTRHSLAHMFRAVQEGIAFSFRYGMDIMAGMDIRPGILRAGYTNLFLSPVFTQTLSNLASVKIELYNTEGAVGAALGSGLGAGIYHSLDEMFGNLHCIQSVFPDQDQEKTAASYLDWENVLTQKLQH
ncbi:MAG: FGGY family carbohydrate kinase [Bacteroidota bacterium]